MLARLSIRAKITAVVALMLVAMSAMGALNIRQMYVINSSTVDIVSNWLPSVQTLGEVRAATITYRAIVRSHLLATNEAGKQAQEELLAKWIDPVVSSIEPPLRLMLGVGCTPCCRRGTARCAPTAARRWRRRA